MTAELVVPLDNLERRTADALASVGALWLDSPRLVALVRWYLQRRQANEAELTPLLDELDVLALDLSLEAPPSLRAVPRLSPREMEMLIGIAQGRENGEIGRALFLSEDTVKAHNRKLFRKLGAKGRAHAVAIAYQVGLLGGAR